MFLYLNTIFSHISSALNRLLNSALSWTFSSLGFNSNGLESLDKNTATLEPARLVDSACADFNGTSSYVSCGALDGYTVQGDWSSTIQIIDPVEASGAFSAIFDKNGIKSLSSGQDGFSMYILTNEIVFQIKINGNNSYVASGTMIYPGLNDVTYGVIGNKVFIDINGTTVIGNTLPVNYLVYRWNSQPMLIGMRVGAVSPAAFNAYDVNFPCGSSYPLQKSCYDVSGNANHGTPTDITWGTQDYFHYNELNGCDRYTDDATGLLEVYVPYVSDTPVVSSISGYTKQSEHPAGTYNNGCETKHILGATTYDTGDEAWNVAALVQAADTEHILHDVTTSYGIAQSYSDMKAEQGEYLFIDVSTEFQYKNMLLFSSPLTGQQSITIHNFINNGDNLVLDSNGNHVFDSNNYAVWS